MKIIRLSAKSHQKFGWGLCAEFAIALNQVFGWPLGAFYEIEPPNALFDDEGYIFVHAFAYSPKGYADHRGIRSRAAMVPNLMASDMTPLKPELTKEQKVTVQDLENESGEGIDWEQVKEAKRWILKNRKVYQ